MTPAVPLYGYQKRWLLDQSRFKVGMFARQTGKTFTTSLEIVDDCFAAEAAGRRARWVILSRGERQAREAMEEGVKLHCKAYSLAIDESETSFWGEETRAAYKQLEVTLPGGSRITALPANPDTARGFSANVFLDEFAIHKDSRAIWAALFPVVSKAGLKLRVTSTPKGRGNKFYDLMTAEDSIWSRHTVDIYKAVADGLDRNIDELRAGLADEEIWRQEYELQWLDGDTALFDWELINGAMSPLAGIGGAYQGGICFVGNDIGRRGDRWVLSVFELVGDVLWLRELIILHKKTFAEHDAAMDSVMRRYRVAALWMDQTGMGEKPVEDAQRRYGEAIVRGWIFSGPTKLYLAAAAKQKLEDRRVRIGSTESAPIAAITSDLYKIKRIEDGQGVIRLVAERDANGHADIAWSVILALAAAGGEQPAYGGYASAAPRRSAADTGARGGSSDRMKMRADDDDYGGRRSEGAY